MTNITPYSPAYFKEVERGLLEFGFKLITNGKVRNVYSYDNQILMVTTDRISAFDVISKQTIPYKGQVLNGVASYFLKKAHENSICPVWLHHIPNQNTMVGVKCEPVKVEMVIRGNLVGHAWREYQKGKRTICGVTMPDFMAENDFFPEPIITPTTKASEGHDEDISKEEILNSGLVKPVVYSLMEQYTRKLFEQGTKIAEQHNLFLADTKYEFGISPNSTVTLIDEVNTPDSSRFFQMEGFYKRQRNGKPQIQLSKEFLREWLIKEGYTGQDGMEFPIMPSEIVSEVSLRYNELYYRLVGKDFVHEELTVDQFIESIIS